MRNPLKLPGVPQTNETISAASGPKFTILWGYVEEILLLNKFCSIVNTCLSCEDIARQSCAMVPRWRFLATFLGPAFAVSHVRANCVPSLLDSFVYCVSLYMWTWWYWSLSLGLLLPSVLWHCWLGHLTCKKPFPKWPIICVVGCYILLNLNVPSLRRTS